MQIHREMSTRVQQVIARERYRVNVVEIKKCWTGIDVGEYQTANRSHAASERRVTV